MALWTVVLAIFIGLGVRCCGQPLIGEVPCSLSVVVDEVDGKNCSLPGSVLQQNHTCNSLKDTLSLISELSSESCVEIIINHGRYAIEGTVIVHRNLLIRGRETHVVKVDLLVQPSSRFQYSLSFRNMSSIRIWNIEFIGSNGVVGFDNVSRVEIMNSSFRNFTQGAVDIFNCYDVTVYNCSFENNGPVTINKLIPIRGHAGGLSLAFSVPPVNMTRLTAVVRDSRFYNNTVLASGNARQTTSQILTRLLVTGRGGGCAINIHSRIKVDVTVAGCIFEKNSALSYGGGVYLALTFVSNHTITLTNISFIDNKCPGGAGGLEIGFAFPGSQELANKVFASNLRFIGNSADYGGGAYVFVATNALRNGATGSFVSFRDCVFERNVAVEYGGAVGLIVPSHNVIFDNRAEIVPVQFHNCSFINNNGGRGGVVSTSYLPLSFNGHNRFLDNTGTSLTVIGTLVHLYGQLSFLNNDVSGNNGGAVYALSLGQLELANGSNIVFTNNSGNLGASIVVNTIFVPQLYTELIGNPLCVILLEDQSQSFSSIDPNHISVTFSGNKAVVGAAVYTNEIGLCSWTGVLGGNKDYFNRSLAFRWDFIDYRNDNQDSAHFPDDRNPRHYVQTKEGQLKVATTNVTAYPGESVEFGVEFIDQLNLPTVAVFRFSDAGSMKEDLLDVEFSPSVVSLNHVNQASINISFLANPSRETRGPANVIVESLLQNNVAREVFRINVMPCPPGYVIYKSNIHPHLSDCQCELENAGVVSCDGLNIQIQDGYWAIAASGGVSLQTYSCPHRYCRCSKFSAGRSCSNVLKGSEADSQCVCGRKGTLCGSCRDEKGVSAILNRCVSCSNISALLIVALVVADSLVYIALILLNLQFPAWLFPCLLYVQILPFIADHFPPTFGASYHALYYISSASSFYFAYDFCLLRNLAPLLSYLFRYLPLFIALIVCTVMFSIVRYCKPYREEGHRLKSWNGVWWIANLMYSHVVYTSMMILNCPKLDTNSHGSSLRWYVCGDVNCFKGLHLPLALLAIVVLLACFLAIPFTAILTTKKVHVFQKLYSHLTDPLSEPFKSEYCWWVSVELARRFVLILAVVAFPANDCPAMLIISVYIVIMGMTWPYRDTGSNLLDLLLSVDVMILLLLNNTRQLRDEFNDVNLEKVNDPNQCLEYKFEAPTLSYIMLPFYYLPLLLSLIACCVWIVILIRKRVCIQESDVVDRNIALSDSNLFGRFERAPTLSEINLEDFTNSSLSSHYSRVIS